MYVSLGLWIDPEFQNKNNLYTEQDVEVILRSTKDAKDRQALEDILISLRTPRP